MLFVSIKCKKFANKFSLKVRVTPEKFQTSLSPYPGFKLSFIFTEPCNIQGKKPWLPPKKVWIDAKAFQMQFSWEAVLLIAGRFSAGRMVCCHPSLLTLALSRYILADTTKHYFSSVPDPYPVRSDAWLFWIKDPDSKLLILYPDHPFFDRMSFKINH